MFRPPPLTLGIAALVSGLAIAGPSAAASTGHLTIRVVNSPAGGDPGFFYVGGPLNITVNGTAPARSFELCITPAPVDRPSCHKGHVGKTIDSLAPSRSGLTKLRVDFGNKVYVRYIRVRRAP